MGYIEKEKVKEIREKIKKTFPNFKFSVVRRHSSTIKIDILKGPIDFGTSHSQVNTYYIDRHWDDKPDAKAFLETIKEIVQGVKTPRYYDTADYGTQPDYYLYIHIGRWNKPYEVKN